MIFYIILESKIADCKAEKSLYLKSWLRVDLVEYPFQQKEGAKI